VITQIDSEAARLGISELIDPVLTEQSPADQLCSIIKNNLLRSMQIMAYNHNATIARLQLLESLENEVRESREELVRIQRGQAKFEKENVYLRKYFKEYGPSKFKLLAKEKQLALLELEDAKK